jgi:glycosyltransferase involved in cell wall biosynthesis
MTRPRVSVVIPSYNHEAFVGAAVASALASEDAGSLEVVVVDDGSTDQSRDRLEAFRGDPRVRLHFQDNAGADAALNLGCGLARGELIVILNSDDELAPGRIAVLGERLRANPAAVLAASWIRVVDAAGAELGVKQAWRTLPPWPPTSPGPYLSDLGDPRLALLETNWISTTSNMAFPAALVREHGLRFAPLRYAHDWDFALAAGRLGEVELVEAPLVSYRVHGANTIGEGDAAGQGRMRFEILWVVARHAARLLRSTARSDAEHVHLRRLLTASAPTFGRDPILDQLLMLRGADPDPPASYDALLDDRQPFTRSAIAVLGGG